ncbi:MAG TPA: pilus assembly protein N-terminal domain-containing protein [Verrucomicrobiae bacterium]|nr:pilus assembly protein N-terminal domain-containing protein [Verrucomicrobiae bacterium]
MHPAAAVLAAFALLAAWQPAAPSASPSSSPPASPAPIVTPASLPEGSEAPPVSPPASPSASPSPTASPTPPPIVVTPGTASVPVGTTQRLVVGSALGTIGAVVADPAIASVTVDQTTQALFLTGKAPGATTLTVSDSRGLTTGVAVRVAYYAGSIAPQVALEVTGDPASAGYIREQIARTVVRAAQIRPGAQVVLSPDDIPWNDELEQDRVGSVDVPVLIQGSGYFEVDGTTHVDVSNVAVPRISPDSLMVSDFPERLEENGVLFAADLRDQTPSRFLYFHYNPPGQPDRRIVLRADNHSSEPAIVQFISGRGGPTPNELEAGHTSTKAFLVDVVSNQGRLITIPADGWVNVIEQDLPAGDVVSNLLQLRVLSGGDVHLTLYAQNASDDPDVAFTNLTLLQGTHKHARGIYAIPEFYYATQWDVQDAYLELPIGQLPLPNRLQGEALAGDYGVLQSFTVEVRNPLATPQAIAVYENPRGGRATATYLIDGVLVQSHQVPPYSRYKVRQYVVPARGFVRVTIVTMPEPGSSYPLKLIFAPDDGSVAPGAPGSPIY